MESVLDGGLCRDMWPQRMGHLLRDTARDEELPV